MFYLTYNGVDVCPIFVKKGKISYVRKDHGQSPKETIINVEDRYIAVIKTH
jgi:hypothetical protein